MWRAMSITLHGGYSERPRISTAPLFTSGVRLSPLPPLALLAELKFSSGTRSLGKIFRERGWWKLGLEKLASYATPLEGWVGKGQTPDAQIISELTGALQNTASNEPPLFDDSTTAQIYRNGTEMGLLGLHASTHEIYATDESLEGGRMGAGVYIVRSGKALRCRMGRSCESRTSLRVETGASFLALEHGKDIKSPILILTDSACHLFELDDWVGPGKFPTLHSY
jgi:hypothetical protein